MLPELRSSHEFLFRPEAKGFIVVRASHKTVAGDDACWSRKLIVIQQIVVIFILDLPGCVVKNAVMSIYWLSLVSVDNFVHLAIRKGL